MAPEHGDRYKYVRRFLKEEFPGKALSRPGVLEAAKACGELGEALFRRSLGWGPAIPPFVVPWKLFGRLGQYAGYFRWYVRWAPQYEEGLLSTIRIHSDLLDDFNLGKREVVLTKVGLVTILEATLLHEMMHWGAYRDLHMNSSFDEDGNEFERRIYGQIIDY